MNSISLPYKIIQAVCFHFDVTEDELYSNDNKKRLTDSRKCLIWLLKNKTNMGYNGITKLLNRTVQNCSGSKKWMYKHEVNNTHTWRTVKAIIKEIDC